MAEETSTLLKVLNTGFVICLVLAIVFFLIAVLLFFVFNIKQVFLIRSGKAAKRDIKKLEQENFNTGRLAQATTIHRDYTTDTLETSKKLGKTGTMGSESTEKLEAENTSASNQEMQQADNNSTTVLGQNETTVLNGEYTTVLNNGETTVLSGSQAQTGRSLKFEIIKKDIYIHTEECI